MKIMLQISIVFGICWLGELISALLPFPFPTSVLGMLLIFLALQLKILRVVQMETTINFFLKNMAFFFIPTSVSILKYYGILSQQLWQFVLICLLSTLITFSFTAAAVSLVLRFSKKGEY
ncbi:MAG: CidA/LrgA family protein [Clostridia bacterium]